jgi:hypothetical protein
VQENGGDLSKSQLTSIAETMNHQAHPWEERAVCVWWMGGSIKVVRACVRACVYTRCNTAACVRAWSIHRVRC